MSLRKPATPTTHDAALAQAVAETYWRAATSENNDVAWCGTATYQTLTRALIVTVQAVYQITPHMAHKVRDLVSEYGPHDSLVGTSGRGVASYVEYAFANLGRQF